VGTDKRERQKTARQLKIEAEQRAAARTRRKRTAIRLGVGAVVVVAGLLLYSVVWGDDEDDAETADASDGSDEPTDESTTVPETTTTTFSDPALAEEVLGRGQPDPEPPPGDVAPDALEVSTLIEGQADTAVASGDTVVVHYVGELPDGTVFDTSWEIGQPYPVESIGQAGVIDGWNEGLIGATLGERRRLVIGSNKAYGAQGFPPDIPPDTPLVFEIDVVDIIPAG
jgi:FKBP-type peptidyl-prolyl cis-trans isomerase